MSDDNGGNGNVKSILDNEQVFQLFMAAVDERVTTRLQARFDVFRNWLSVVLTLLAVVIPAVGGFVYSYVVENITKEAAREAVDRAIGDARFDSQTSALNFRVLSIDVADAFSNEDAEVIMSEIASLYSQHADTESRDRLRFAVETAAKNFAQANRPDFVSRLEGIAPEVFQTSANATVSQIMTQILGNRLLAHAGAPRSWADAESPMRNVYVNYQRHAARAYETGYPELYLAYELLLAFVEERPRDEISNLIRDTATLNDQDSENFVNLITSLAAGDLDIAGSERVARRTGEFLCQFGDKSVLLTEISRNADLQCP